MWSVRLLSWENLKDMTLSCDIFEDETISLDRNEAALSWDGFREWCEEVTTSLREVSVWTLCREGLLDEWISTL